MEAILARLSSLESDGTKHRAQAAALTERVQAAELAAVESASKHARLEQTVRSLSAQLGTAEVAVAALHKTLVEVGRSALPEGFWLWDSKEGRAGARGGRWLWSKPGTSSHSRGASSPHCPLLPLPVELLSSIMRLTLLTTSNGLLVSRLGCTNWYLLNLFVILTRRGEQEWGLDSADAVDYASCFVGPPSVSIAQRLVPYEILLDGIPPSDDVQDVAHALTGTGQHAVVNIQCLGLKVARASLVGAWADVLLVFDPTEFELSIRPAAKPDHACPTPSVITPEVASRILATWTRLHHVAARGPGSAFVFELTGELAARTWVLGHAHNPVSSPVHGPPPDPVGSLVYGPAPDPVEQLLVWEENGGFVSAPLDQLKLNELSLFELSGRTAFQVVVGKRRPRG